MSITPAGEPGYTLTRHADALHERLNEFLDAERVMFALSMRDAPIAERAVARRRWSERLRALRETIERGRPSSLV